MLGRMPGKDDDHTDPLPATEGIALIASVLLLIAAAVSLTYAYLPIRKTGKHWFLYGLAASLTILVMRFRSPSRVSPPLGEAPSTRLTWQKGEYAAVACARCRPRSPYSVRRVRRRAVATRVRRATGMANDFGAFHKVVALWPGVAGPGDSRAVDPLDDLR